MHAAGTRPAPGALDPMGHVGEMSDIVNAILYLNTAPFVTGEIPHVDGGQNDGHSSITGAPLVAPLISFINKES
jgi:NAD(P)-dependent dehydrogenase (short-subunit alcohol dehydrogenase family)